MNVRRLVLLVLLATATTAAVLSARDPSAGWSAAIRSESRGRVQITSRPVLGLYPGARKRLVLVLTNRDAVRGVAVRHIHVRDVATTKRGCSASQRNLSIHQYQGPALTIRPRGTRRVGIRLTMPSTVADACQRAIFNLQYTAETQTIGPRR
jgi:hypothetical protein